MAAPDLSIPLQLDGEIWKPIPDFPGYEASNLGRIRSYWSRSRIRNKAWILKGGPVNGGYRAVSLKSANKTVARTVCTLVLRAFVGPPERGFECCHGNGINTDDRLGNLRWGTRKDNTNDKVLHGTVPKGRDLPQTKLTEESVAAIREEYIPGVFGFKKLAKKYGVRPATIQDILARRTWKHVA